MCAGTGRRGGVARPSPRGKLQSSENVPQSGEGGGVGARHWGGRRDPSAFWGGRLGRVEGHMLGTVAWGAPLGGAVPSRPAPPSPHLAPVRAVVGGGGGVGRGLAAGRGGVGAARRVRAAPTCFPAAAEGWPKSCEN